MDRDQAGTFFEADEPTEKIKGIVDRGPTGYTASSSPRPSVSWGDPRSLVIKGAYLVSAPVAFEFQPDLALTVSR